MKESQPRFYGPQGRVLRLNIQDESLNSKMDNFKFEENRITNPRNGNGCNPWPSALLGHNALSLAIIANRATGTFVSEDPYKAVADELITYLDKLANN
jgi:uridine phosphorylase